MKGPVHTLYRKMPPSLENDHSILQNISTRQGLGLQTQASRQLCPQMQCTLVKVECYITGRG